MFPFKEREATQDSYLVKHFAFHGVQPIQRFKRLFTHIVKLSFCRALVFKVDIATHCRTAKFWRGTKKQNKKEKKEEEIAWYLWENYVIKH